MKVPAGSQLFIGPPAKPMPSELSHAIGVAVGRFPQIEEAHLPMVFVKGRIEPPAQVLVLVMQQQIVGLLPRIMDSVQLLIPVGSHLDAFEFPANHPLLATIRSTQTKLDLCRESE